MQCIRGDLCSDRGGGVKFAEISELIRHKEDKEEEEDDIQQHINNA
jgi:hypothetical protein